MKKSLPLLLPLLAWLASGQAGRPSLGEPSVVPGRGEVVFVSGGDIWTAPLKGGEARLLVSHPATESRPLFSPDGSRLAFVSTRTGGGDIYVLTIAGGALQRLTFDDGMESLENWSPDGEWLYFSAARAVNLADIYRVSVKGGTPMAVSADHWMSEFHAAPARTGGALAFAARGMSNNQWWRHGHSHIDESEIWQLDGGKYTPLVEMGARNNWPMWSADGKTLFFMSDRGGAENLWVLEAGRARQLTTFKDGRLLWPAISNDAKTIVFERNFGLWSYETGTKRAAAIPVELRGAPAGAGSTRVPLNSFSGLALSPDGKKLAVTARGEVWAAQAAPTANAGGEAVRVTRSSASEGSVVWAPGSRAIAYTSERNGHHQLFHYDFGTQTEKQLTRAGDNDAGPRFSPDGKLVAFVRGRKELRTVSVETGEEKLLVTAPIMGALAWSPDGKWIAYSPAVEKGFRNPHVVPAAGGEAKPLSFLANSFTTEPLWSPDGRYLYFSTTQRTEQTRVARIELTPKVTKFREELFRDLFKEEPKKDEAKKGEAAKAPVQIEFEGVRERIALLSTGLDGNAVAISGDGKWLLINAEAAGQTNLYLWSIDELAEQGRREPAVPRQLTTTAGFKSSAQFSPDSKEVWYVENGRVNALTIESRQSRSVNLSAEIDVDFDVEKVEVFRQAWGVMRDVFYDSNYHGADWNAVKASFEPQAAGARTPDELRRVISLMLGELNASHLGISGPMQNPGAPVGKLGLEFDRAQYEAAGAFRVSQVVSLGPADLAQVKAGDVLTAVDGVALSARSNIDDLLRGKAGRRVELKFGDKTVAVRPVTAAVEGNLRYRQWVAGRRAYVEKASGGKLGYVHMRDMGDASLNQLYVDLDTQNQTRQGVVIDIRNNNGGFVNAYALDVFSRRPYLRMETRGMPQAPARAQLGQRALELPTILVTNQYSLSDAEDFTEGYRALKLGKVVGEPTAGWIIYTGAAALLDGSTLRTPGTKVFDSQGKVMELNPRPVDVAVTRPVGETLSEKDSQLDAAVRELLAQINAAQGR